MIAEMLKRVHRKWMGGTSATVMSCAVLLLTANPDGCTPAEDNGFEHKPTPVQEQGDAEDRVYTPTRVKGPIDRVELPDLARPMEALDIDYRDFTLDILHDGDGSVAQTFTFFAGADVESFRFELTAAQLEPEPQPGDDDSLTELNPRRAKLEVLSGGGQLVQTIETNGRITTGEISGNVGLLRVTAAAWQQYMPPQITVHSLHALRAKVRLSVPLIRIERGLANSVSSAPLALNEPVEMALTPDQRTYFFSISGVAGRNIDVAVDGAGRELADGSAGAKLRIVDAAAGAFPLSDAPIAGRSVEVWPRFDAGDPTTKDDDRFRGAPFRRFAPATTDTLLLAVTNEGVGGLGHVRIRVNEIVSTGLSFPSDEPEAFTRMPFSPATVVIGVDRDPAPGAAMGIFPATLDCTNYAGLTGMVTVSGPPVWVPGPSHLECVTIWGEEYCVEVPGDPVQVPGPSVPAPRFPPVCYDGHEGTDYPLLLGRIGQEIGVDVTAAAAGIVVRTGDGHADDCFADPFNEFKPRCPDTRNPANFIIVRQNDGLVAAYFHLATDSVAVSVGQRVACGQFLGLAASSGDSTAPHLHFELQNLSPTAFDPNAAPVSVLQDWSLFSVRNSGVAVDPYLPNLWAALDAFGEPIPVCP
ncbi:putative peptidase [Phycisphaerae bacterium RAS1]|nr:putative peptidase [Phycisphaerae bacterium RAS1]